MFIIWWRFGRAVVSERYLTDISFDQRQCSVVQKGTGYEIN